MRNADTPAMPLATEDHTKAFVENNGRARVTSGFTKYEAVMLGFANALIQHYSRSFELLSPHRDEIMNEAASMTDAYFDRLEKQP